MEEGNRQIIGGYFGGYVGRKVRGINKRRQ